MTCIIMTYGQIESMVAKEDGYTDINQWREDMSDFYQSIYDLVTVEDMGFCNRGRYYIFTRTDGRKGVWYR